MGKDPGTGSATVTEAQEAAQIQREIEQTREELGNTVEELARKTDVKAQAKQRLDDTKATVIEKKEQILGKAREPERAVSAASQASRKARDNPTALALAGAFAAGFLASRSFRR